MAQWLSCWQRRSLAYPSVSLALCFAMASGISGVAGEPGWSSIPGPTALPPQAIGGHALGCLHGAARLELDGPGHQVMRPSRVRYYGHPQLIKFVQWLGNEALAQGRSGILVGDLAQARGGPMTSGHASHQSGLDVDIWYLPPPTGPLSFNDRETLSAVSMVSADGLTTRERWTRGHVELLHAAASHPQVDRIFVNAAIKQELCETVSMDRSWLSKIRPWWGHDHHFHVRLACPEDSLNCSTQAPPPPSDGCDEGLAWWFSNEAKQALADQKKQPPKIIALSDLPAECSAVYSWNSASPTEVGNDVANRSLPHASAQRHPDAKPPE